MTSGSQHPKGGLHLSVIAVPIPEDLMPLALTQMLTETHNNA